jgi:hypothetical protein
MSLKGFNWYFVAALVLGAAIDYTFYRAVVVRVALFMVHSW